MDSLHHPDIQTLEWYARETGNRQAIPIRIHLPADAQYNRTRELDVDATVELRAGMMPLVTVAGLAPVTWELRKSAAGRATGNIVRVCTHVPPPTPQVPIPIPIPASPAAAQRPPAAGPVAVPAPAQTVRPVAPATPTQTTSGAGGGTGSCPPPATANNGGHPWRTALIVFLVIAGLMCLGAWLQSINGPQAPSPATRTVVAGQPAPTIANGPKAPAGKLAPVDPPAKTATPQTQTTASGDDLELGSIPCQPAASEMVNCEMTATNNGKEAARFVLVGPWTIHGVDHGYASGDAKGDHAAIQLTDIDCPYEGGWRNHAVTLPPGGSAAFSIRFSNRGLGSTKYTLDIPFEWKNDPGIPFEFLEIKDVPFNPAQ